MNYVDYYGNHIDHRDNVYVVYQDPEGYFAWRAKVYNPMSSYLWPIFVKRRDAEHYISDIYNCNQDECRPDDTDGSDL